MKVPFLSLIALENRIGSSGMGHPLVGYPTSFLGPEHVELGVLDSSASGEHQVKQCR